MHGLKEGAKPWVRECPTEFLFSARVVLTVRFHIPSRNGLGDKCSTTATDSARRDQSQVRDDHDTAYRVRHRVPAVAPPPSRMSADPFGCGGAWGTDKMDGWAPTGRDDRMTT
jgi:hypothetical protein